jgi:hypothetical protein
VKRNGEGNFTHVMQQNSYAYADRRKRYKMIISGINAEGYFHSTMFGLVEKLITF